MAHDDLLADPLIELLTENDHSTVNHDYQALHVDLPDLDPQPGDHHQLDDHQLDHHQLDDHQLDDHQLDDHQLDDHQTDDHQPDHHPDHRQDQGHNGDLPEAEPHDIDHGGYGHYDHEHNYMEEVHFISIVPADPADGKAWRFQPDEFGCVISAERGVLDSLGRDVSFEDMREEALSSGIYDPTAGIHAKDIGRLLEAHGLTVERSFDNQIPDLVEALQHKFKVLVSLDSREIGHPIHGPGGAPLEQPDQAHVVWVTDIEAGANGGLRIILNDSGNPNGRLMPVDGSDFLNAWADFGNFAVFVHRP